MSGDTSRRRALGAVAMLAASILAVAMRNHYDSALLGLSPLSLET